MSYSVYIVECADGSYYTGITRNLETRVAEHNNSAKGAKYTRSRRPVTLRWSESVANRSEAQKREHSVRSLSRLAKAALIKAG